MKRIYFLPLLFVLAACSQSFAQVEDGAFGYYIDALTFSRQGAGGTARTLGMGGVQNALGADLSVTTKNPAGIGVFRTSSLSFTPALMFGNSNSTYSSPTGTQNIRSATRDNFYIGNLGLVFAESDDGVLNSDWRSQGFAITFNRLADYNNRFYYKGQNDLSSFRNVLLEGVQGNTNTQAFPFEEGINDNYLVDNLTSAAYNLFLINDGIDENGDTTNVPVGDGVYYTFDNGSPVIQEETVTTSGAKNQWDLAYGANYKDLIYIGAGIGITTIRHNRELDYKETVLSGDNGILDSYQITERYETSGIGVNFKIGMIVRPADVVRIGASIETPTRMALTEQYFADMSVNFKEDQGDLVTRAEVYPGEFNYRLTTPFIARGGVAFFIGKNGFISGDLEYLSYNRASLDADGTTLSDDNQTINTIYSNALNLKFGGEYRLDNVYFRGGYAHFGDPFKSGFSAIDQSRSLYSGGIGMRIEDNTFDLAIYQMDNSFSYSPYSSENGSEPIVYTNSSRLNVVFTWGYSF